MPSLSLTTFLIVPLTIMLFVAALNLYFGFVGRFHPWQIMVRALGASVYILGFGLLMYFDFGLNKLNGALMCWAIAIMSIPRLIFMVQQIKLNPEDTRRWRESQGASE